MGLQIAIMMLYQLSSRTKDEITRFCSTVPNPFPTTYGIVIVCIYIIFSYIEYTHTEFDRDERKSKYIEEWNEDRFFMFLYGCGILYFVKIVIMFKKSKFTIMAREDHKESMVNRMCTNFHVAHIGIFILFIGVLAHYILEIMIQLETTDQDNHGYSKAEKLTNICLGILFTILQGYVIIEYPFKIFRTRNVLHKFGIVHIIATNIIWWIETLLEETAYDLCECSKKSTYKAGLYKALMFVYPFVIEFVLIGASIFLALSTRIEETDTDEEEIDFHRHYRRKSSTLKHMLKDSDYSNSLKGLLAGILVLAVSAVSLYLFHSNKIKATTKASNEINQTSYLTSFSINGNETTTEDIALGTSLFNDIVGAIACIGGLVKIQSLKHDPWKRNLISNRSSFDLDGVLLRFSSCFAIMQAIVAIITGSLVPAEDFDYTHGHLHKATGVLDIIEIMLQVLLLKQLKQKVLTKEQEDEKPGRQFVMFLFFSNFSEWLVLTFEIQKDVVTPIEEDLYGKTACIILKRIILPFSIFFRFHSAWLSIELWQELYNEKEHDTMHGSSFSDSSSSIETITEELTWIQ